jgi:exodeoxyribonuclease VII small subunit
MIDVRQQRINQLSRQFRLESVINCIGNEKSKLKNKAAKLRAADPMTSLKRGFSLVYAENGNLVKSISQIQVADTLKTEVSDGVLSVPLTRPKGNKMPDKQDDFSELTYEQKVEKLDEILSRLDNSETPIDKLAEDVKLEARLIKELDKKLKQVETEVRDAFKELEGNVEEE